MLKGTLVTIAIAALFGAASATADEALDRTRADIAREFLAKDRGDIRLFTSYSALKACADVYYEKDKTRIQRSEVVLCLTFLYGFQAYVDEGRDVFNKGICLPGDRPEEVIKTFLDAVQAAGKTDLPTKYKRFEYTAQVAFQKRYPCK